MHRATLARTGQRENRDLVPCELTFHSDLKTPTMRVASLIVFASLALLATAGSLQPPRYPEQASYRLVGNVDEFGGRLAGTLDCCVKFQVFSYFGVFSLRFKFLST